MRRFKRIGLLAMAIVSPLGAQQLADARVAVQRPAVEWAGPANQLMPVQASSETSASTRSMVVGGLIGGALGALGGAMVGYSMEKCTRHSETGCGVGGAVLGGILGESIGVPIGVNWVGNGRGKLTRTIPVSIGLTLGGLVVGVPTYGVGVLLTPVFQIYTAIRTERSSL